MKNKIKYVINVVYRFLLLDVANNFKKCIIIIDICKNVLIFYGEVIAVKNINQKIYKKLIDLLIKRLAKKLVLLNLLNKMIMISNNNKI